MLSSREDREWVWNLGNMALLAPLLAVIPLLHLFQLSCWACEWKFWDWRRGRRQCLRYPVYIDNIDALYIFFLENTARQLLEGWRGIIMDPGGKMKGKFGSWRGVFKLFHVLFIQFEWCLKGCLTISSLNILHMWTFELEEYRMSSTCAGIDYRHFEWWPTCPGGPSNVHLGMYPSPGQFNWCVQSGDCWQLDT